MIMYQFTKVVVKTQACWLLTELRNGRASVYPWFRMGRGMRCGVHMVLESGRCMNPALPGIEEVGPVQSA